MWRNSIIAIFLSIQCYSSFGQYGNEWIDFSQSYYKFKITEDGFYRITRAELAAVGIPVETIPKDRYQLFRRGEEIAINVNTGSTFEWLEFYGERNDGKGDSPLYSPGDQSHTFYNLFSDSASYFITYKLGNEDGKRVGFSADQNATGLTPEPYHLAKEIQLFNASYHTGERFGVNSAFSLSTYGSGEGWTDTFLGKNGLKDYTFTLSNLESDINPRFETVLVGGNSLNHNVNFSAGPDATSLTSIGNSQFSAFGYLFVSNGINSSSIGTDGE